MNSSAIEIKTYLVGYKDESLLEEMELFQVEAGSTEEAVSRYKEVKFPEDKELLEYLACNSYNDSFSAMFWFSTEEERDAFELDGTVLVEPTEFASRLKAAFDGRDDLADAYLEYLDDADEGDSGKLPNGLLEFLMSTDLLDSWARVVAIPLDSIPKL